MRFFLLKNIEIFLMHIPSFHILICNKYCTQANCSTLYTPTSRKFTPFYLTKIRPFREIFPWFLQDYGLPVITPNVQRITKKSEIGNGCFCSVTIFPCQWYWKYILQQWLSTWLQLISTSLQLDQPQARSPYLHISFTSSSFLPLLC